MYEKQIFDISQASPPGFMRRLAAMFYDALLLIGVVMMASALVFLPFGVRTAEMSPAGLFLFRLYLLAVATGFFCWPWMKTGQTLGMRAWKIMLLREDGSRVRLSDALLRLVASLLSWLAVGAGFLWILFDRESRAWHDRLSKTRLVQLSSQ